MPKRAPTNAELDILRVLWQRGPSTVRDVHESLDHAKPVGYTTVLKLLQIMAEKGLARRDASARSHVYAAAASQDATQRRMVADLVRRAYRGPAPPALPPPPGARPPPAPPPGPSPPLPDQKDD